MVARRKCFCVVWLAAVVAVSIASTNAWASGPREADIQFLSMVDAARGLVSASEIIWSGWDIGGPPLAVYRPGDCCYLMGHPKPPPGFARMREDLPFRTTVYSSVGTRPPIDPEMCHLAGVPTVVISPDESLDDLVPILFREAFRVHERTLCPDNAEELDLLTGYPIDTENLAMADIECELLREAASCHPDSLERRILEFVTVRSFRRVRLADRYVLYERRAEFAGGLPLYVAERCREEIPGRLRGRASVLLEDAIGEPGHLLDPLIGELDLAWYRRDRFHHTGAAICAVLDRLRHDWQEEVSERCIAPDVLLFDFAAQRRLNAQEILGRRGYEALLIEKEAMVTALKSEPEKRFERITQSDSLTISVNAGNLSGGSVRYDPLHISQIDDHRAVYDRILKIEYSGGTHVYVMSNPVAVVLGGDEFDFRQLIFAAPLDLTITADGSALEFGRGITHVDRELVVAGTGLSIEASQATVVVGENRISIGLLR